MADALIRLNTRSALIQWADNSAERWTMRPLVPVDLRRQSDHMRSGGRHARKKKISVPDRFRIETSRSILASES